jgi:phage antirepressor YoqD-like protein
MKTPEDVESSKVDNLISNKVIYILCFFCQLRNESKELLYKFRDTKKELIIMLQLFEFKGQAIRMEKRDDGEIWTSLTDMAKASDKKVNNWSRSEGTQQFISALEAITPKRVIESRVGGNIPESERGTWGIQQVAIKFAAWCSVEFEIWMLDKIKTLMNEGSVSIKPKTRLELAREQVLLIEELEEKNKLISLQKGFLEIKNTIINDQDKALTEQYEALAECEPKVQFYDIFREVETNVPVEIFAKTISNKLDGRFPAIGRNNLFKILRKYQFVRPVRYNPPFQRYVNSGMFTVIQKTNNNLNRGYTQTLITPKGQQELLSWFLKKYPTPEDLKRDLI